MAKKRSTREKILKCAVEEFVGYGFYGARMQRIADRAGINKALVFYYFSSKGEIYREALETVIGSVLKRLNAVDERPLRVEVKIGRIIDAYTEVFEKYPDYVRIFQYELTSGGSNLEGIMMRHFSEIPFNPLSGRIFRYFEEKMQKGEIRRLDIFQLLVSIIGQVVMYYIASPILAGVGKRVGLDVAQIKRKRKEFIVDLVMNGIRAG